MALSWAEIKERAIHFSKKWEDAESEASEAQPFLIDFFNIFGVSNRRVTAFETHVKKLNGRDGFIDMLWKGNILIEMKSRGENLERAYNQAKDYFPGLKEYELPKYILVCDFYTFHLYDLEYDKNYAFTLDKLYTKVNLFGFIAGYSSTIEIKAEDPVNIKAAESMGRLHDSLKAIGYEGHDLELYLVRILFCMFADDTTIFNKNIFYDYLLRHSSEDGANLASVINEVFEVLNQPLDKRYKNISEELNAFPYVNGGLFKERLPLASYDTKMRNIILDCCMLDWSKISPAIFGSMFQSVMNPKKRRNLGAHYTSETNILKLIKPLFLDDLWAEFEKVKNNKKQLEALHKKIASLKFLDPACGCGNFLVVTYREIRLLEIAILKAIGQVHVLGIELLVVCDVDNYYGLEYEEFPAQIAQVALWLMDHQMNMKCSEEFGVYFARLPLKKSAHILHTDALELDWNDVVPNTKISYIIGNPPFIGSKLMNNTQRAQVVREFNAVVGSGTLDYVSAWYAKAAKYIANTTIKVAFVSTNSIVQGEQVAILWGRLLNENGIKIHFAHRTFKWSNEARGKAAVYCVIVGFATFDTSRKFIFDYEDVRGEAHEISAKNINAYLVDAQNILISKRSKPLCDVPAMNKGSQPTDDGNLLFTDEEKNDFIIQEPQADKYIRPLISAKEFLNGQRRWCLWLVNANPTELKAMPNVLTRIDNVRKTRLASSKAATREWANIPTQFTENRQPNSNYILVPSHSSENRKYIPLGFFDRDSIANNSCLMIPNGTLYHFGVLMSSMSMVWVKYVCGRIKSDYRYSAGIVYNNFPWAESPTEKQIAKIEECAQAVLDARAVFESSSLADLYDQKIMPSILVKAHNALDRAVDAAYRSAPFATATARIEFLFDLYEKYNATLFPKRKKKMKKL